MIENWYFNAHPIEMFGPCALPDLEINKLCVIRDTKRVTSIGEIAFELLEYQAEDGGFPRLTAGTFVEGVTTSKWPSWVAELGNALGATLPVDPVHVFDPLFDNGTGLCNINDFDQNTCWDETNKRYECPADSHIYQYKYNGGTAYLYANLEYSGTGSWIIGVGNPCSSPSSCACFNYQVDSGDDFGVNYLYKK